MMMEDTDSRMRIQCSPAQKMKQRFLWLGLIVATGVVLGLIIGCQ